MRTSHREFLQTSALASLAAAHSLNAFFGLWWADPAAALIMVPIIAKEGIEGLQGNACDEFYFFGRSSDIVAGSPV